MKKKENRNLWSNQATNTVPSYSNLSSLPLAKIPKNLSKHTNKLSFLTVTITGDPTRTLQLLKFLPNKVGVGETGCT